MSSAGKEFIQIERQVALERVATTIGLIRFEAEDDEAFASRCHYRVADLIRAHAAIRSDAKLMRLTDLLDAIAAAFQHE